MGHIRANMSQTRLTAVGMEVSQSFNVGFILVSSIRQMFPHAPNSHIMKAVNCISQNVC